VVPADARRTDVADARTLYMRASVAAVILSPGMASEWSRQPVALSSKRGA
jgi:hypothetical protein